jgi:hypothetical protein
MLSRNEAVMIDFSAGSQIKSTGLVPVIAWRLIRYW